MKIVTGPGLPKSNGHYSQCVEHNGLLYLSGQLPIHPDTRQIPESVEEQVDLVFENVGNILSAAGSDKDHVLQVRVYIPDVALWDAVNDRYSAFFGAHRPARCIVPTGKLHFGCLIEVEATAVQLLHANPTA